MNEPFRDAAAFPLNRTLFSAHNHDNLVIDPRCQPQGVTYVDENVATPRDLLMMWQNSRLRNMNSAPLPSMNE